MSEKSKQKKKTFFNCLTNWKGSTKKKKEKQNKIKNNFSGNKIVSNFITKKKKTEPVIKEDIK